VSVLHIRDDATTGRSFAFRRRVNRCSLHARADLILMILDNKLSRIQPQSTKKWPRSSDLASGPINRQSAKTHAERKATCSRARSRSSDGRPAVDSFATDRDGYCPAMTCDFIASQWSQSDRPSPREYRRIAAVRSHLADHHRCMSSRKEQIFFRAHHAGRGFP